jgi:hypothetical protein
MYWADERAAKAARLRTKINATAGERREDVSGESDDMADTPLKAMRAKLRGAGAAPGGT